MMVGTLKSKMISFTSRTFLLPIEGTCKVREACAAERLVKDDRARVKSYFLRNTP